jgi:gliding motility-associated-like protein
MKYIYLLLSVICFSLYGMGSANAQIALQYTDTTLCPGQPLIMCADFSGQSSSLNVDDRFTPLLNIGFSFKFFGTDYTKCTASDNNFLSFNAANADQHSSYNWTAAATAPETNNGILLGYLDAYLPESGTIRYQTFGNVGSRRFIVEWCNVAKFINCSPLHFTNQVILYETSNIIEIHTLEMPGTPACPSTDPGRAVQGLKNSTGAIAIYTPNRGPTNAWGATGGAFTSVRFTPNGASTYLIDTTIAYNPWIIIPQANSANLVWYAQGNPNLPIANGACASVITNANTNYYVVKYDGVAGCNTTQTSHFSDTVRIHFGTAYDTTRVEICAGTTYSWFGKTLFSPGNYDTLLSTQMGCDSFLRLKLTVNPLPDVAIKGSANIGICEGSSTILALLNPRSNNTYQWYRDNQLLNNETGATISASIAGKYTVVATSSKGCKATSQAFTLVVNPNPVAKIEPLPDEIICAYDTLELIAEQHPSLDYRWSPEKPFRAVTGAEGQKVKGIFIDASNEIVLTVFNQYGCYDSDTTIVKTKPCCEVLIPNAFSPNGDGNNDYFKPFLQPGQILLNLRVFDRYGKIVYNNENIKQGWNGAYDDGSEAASGVYMYYMKYTCADGKLYEKKESVTLIR